MKVAICFYGQPRKYKKVIDQWQKVIKELNADVFIQTWYGEDRGRNFIDINGLIEDFQPKEIKVSKPHKFIDLIPTDSTYETQSYHAMQQAYATTGCFQTITIFSEILKTPFKKQYLFNFRKNLNVLLHRINSANKLGSIFNSRDQKYLVYTYWFTQWTLIFSIINSKQKNISLYTRIHGMDVYEDQHADKEFFFPFRYFQAKQITDATIY